MRVVVFSPADSYTASSLPELSPDDHVAVVCWAGADKTESTTRIQLTRSVVADRLARAAARHVALRTLLRVSPFDPGAVFWRAVRGSKDAAHAAREADLLVAAERDGGYATWMALQRVRRGGSRPRSVSGYPAARAAVDRSR